MINSLHMIYKVLFVFAIGLIPLIILHKKNISKLSHRKSIFLFFTRTIVVLIISLFVCDFFFTLSKTKWEKGKVIFLIDTSESMGISDIGEMRFEKAINILNDLRKHFSKNFDIKIYKFSHNAEILQDLKNLKLQGKSTSIGNAINAVKEENSNIIILSDGISNSGEDINYVLEKQNKNKIFSIGIGGDGIKDVKITDIIYPKNIPRGERIQCDVIVEHNNATGEKIKAVLRENNNPITSSDIILKDKIEKIVLTTKANKIGLIPFEVEIVSNFDEKIKINNSRKFYINVTKDKFKVIFFGSAPSYEFAFLKREFSKFEKFDFIYLLPRDKNNFYPQYINNKRQITPTRDKLLSILSECDILILQDISPNYFNASEIREIKKFVLNKSGSLLLLGGEDGILSDKEENPFDDLLPFIPQKKNNYSEDIFKVEPDERYLLHPVLDFTGNEQQNKKILQDMGIITSLNKITNLKNDAQVLVRVKNSKNSFPFIIYRKIHKSKTITIATDTLWQTCFRNPEKSNFGIYCSKLLYQILMFLSQRHDETIAINFDKDVYQEGDSVNFFIDVNTDEKIDDIDIKVEGKHKIEDILYIQDIDLQNRFEGNFKVDKKGEYKLQVKAIKDGKTLFSGAKNFDVLPASLEFENTKLNRELLTDISNKTGGKYYDFQNYEKIKQDIPNKKTKVVERKKIEIRQLPLLLIVAIILLIFEWIVRRRWGII